IVKEGGLIAYPTNTVYGLGADPLNSEAVEQIFSLKNRDREMGLPVLISDFEEGKKVAIFGKYELKLAENFWPGELTIILPLKTAEDSSNNDENTIFLDKIVSGGKNTIALRVPKNPIILGICQEIKKNSKFGGVIGTSANFSGAPNPTNGKVVIEQLSYAVNLIIDTGKCIDKIPSTIVKIDNEILKDGGSLDD
ncbi:MAG: threonylcarbamoyl-AMP synthase, partial [archaeon]|nr:threonylcarbamoyl-AMP synthase [archaeon]